MGTQMGCLPLYMASKGTCISGLFQRRELFLYNNRTPRILALASHSTLHERDQCLSGKMSDWEKDTELMKECLIITQHIHEGCTESVYTYTTVRVFLLSSAISVCGVSLWVCVAPFFMNADCTRDSLPNGAWKPGWQGDLTWGNWTCPHSQPGESATLSNEK